jgi:hypothetical protein
MTSHDIEKALEVWTLQNLFNISIMLGILATGLAMVQGYYQSLEKQLSLRVSIELWRVLVIVVVDVLLAIVVLVGYLVLNPDIMADIKMAVPFCPIAAILFAAALVLRLFHGGHDAASKSHRRSLYLMLGGDVLNIIGFTFIMEAPSKEYLALHPSAFWAYLKTHLRSNADPHGLELSQITFDICFPILVALLVWGVWSALHSAARTKSE